MRLFINAGFGEPIGLEMLRTLKPWFAGVRQDIPSGEATEVLLKELAEADVDPILLLAGGKTTMDPPAIAELAEHVAIIAGQVGLWDRKFPLAIEIGNEPEAAPAYKADAARFAEAVRMSHERIKSVSSRVQVITGGIISTDRRGLDYLAAADRAGLPKDCVIGYHAYRSTDVPESPVDGFENRADEFAELKRIAAGRPIWCTEVGWHTDVSTVRYGPFDIFKKTVQFSDEQVADFAEREVRINAAQGALGLVWFQLRDAEHPTDYEGHFGIRSADGQWKPVAYRLGSLGPVVV